MNFDLQLVTGQGIDLRLLMRMCSLFLLAGWFQSCGKQQHLPQRPNIVLILADDMGYSDLGCMGSEIPTPNLDRLAANGLVMPNFYNAARCCPTRAALLTGLYPHQAGMGDMVEGRLWQDSTFLPAYQGWLGNNVLTLAEALRKGGYQTFLSGKWHLGNQRAHWPDRRGFERNFAMIHGAGNYFNNAPWFTDEQFLQYILDGDPYEWPDSSYLTDLITDYALEFVRSADSESPFFLYLSYTAPHWPLHAPEVEIDRFRGQYIDGWETVRHRRFEKMKRLGWLSADMDLTAAFHNVSNPALSPDWDTLSRESRAIWDLRMAVYAAQVNIMDRNIGRLLEVLSRKGQLENTLIFFLSDNGATDAAIYLTSQWVAEREGPIGSARSFDAYGARWANLSNTPYSLFKSTVAEGGIKTPLIVHYPAEISGRQISENYGHVIDILPTCLEIAGIDFSEIAGSQNKLLPEGNSLRPLWMHTPFDDQRPLLWEHHDHWAVRKGPWKLLHLNGYNKDGKGDRLELYNLESDPAETKNLLETYPQKAKAMQEWYQEKAREIGVQPFDSLILANSM